MPYSTAGKNLMLDALGTAADFVSLHSAYPGDTGASEISGGSPAYARKAKTWNAASGATKDDSNALAFDVAAGTTVAFVGLWDAVTAGAWLGYAPLGGTPYRYTVDTATDVFTVTAHGFADTNEIVFMNGTAPTGLTEGTIYFVRDSTANTFKVAATSGGAAIDITGQPAAASRVSKIVREVFAGQGTYTPTDIDIDLLDT